MLRLSRRTLRHTAATLVAALGFDGSAHAYLLSAYDASVYTGDTAALNAALGLTTLTAGSYVAVGGYFGHYALAIAQEIMVDQIKTVGSDNVTFQALMYMQGTPLVATSFARLKTV